MSKIPMIGGPGDGQLAHLPAGCGTFWWDDGRIMTSQGRGNEPARGDRYEVISYTVGSTLFWFAVHESRIPLWAVEQWAEQALSKAFAELTFGQSVVE